MEKAVRAICDQMPNMVRRQSLVFHNWIDDLEEDWNGLDMNDIIRHLFIRNSPYFKNLILEEITQDEVAQDDQQPEPPEAQLYESIRFSEVSDAGYCALCTLETDDDLL